MASLTPAKSSYFYRKADKSYHCSNMNDHYSNIDAIDNAINYVTRAGSKNNERGFVSCGMTGCCYAVKPKDYIMMFKQVQERARGDKPISSYISHEILTLGDNEERFLCSDLNALLLFAYDCACIYYELGHQCVYGIHNGFHSEQEGKLQKRLHIHFIVNNVNYITGNLFPTHISSKPFTFNNGKTFFRVPYDTKVREAQMNQLLYEKYMQTKNPYAVEEPNDYCKNAYDQYPKARVDTPQDAR